MGPGGRRRRRRAGADGSGEQRARPRRPRRRCRRAAGAGPAGRRRCRCRAAARPGAPRAAPPRRPAPASGGARSCRARSSGRSRPGAPAAGRWSRVPWRSGTITTSGPAGAGPASSSCSSAGDSAGQSPGTHRTRSKPSSSARWTPSEAAADWPCLELVLDQHQAGAAPVGQLRLAADDDRQLDRGRGGERLEHVGEHRAHERVAQRLLHAGPEPLLGRREALHGQDRGGSHQPAPEPRGEAERLLGQALAARRRRPCGCRCRGSAAPGTVFVGDDAVEQLAVEARDAGGAELLPGVGHEGGRRPLQDLAGDDRADGHHRRGRRRASPRGCRGRPGSGRSTPAGWTGRSRSPRRGRARRARPATARRSRRRGTRGPRAVPSARSWIMNCWKARQPPEGVLTQVRTGSSLIGSTRLRTPIASFRRARACGRRVALRHQPGALGAPGQVAVAEVEPHLRAELAQAVHHGEGVAPQAPAALVDQRRPARRTRGRGRARRRRRRSRCRRRC